MLVYQRVKYPSKFDLDTKMIQDVDLHGSLDPTVSFASSKAMAFAGPNHMEISEVMGVPPVHIHLIGMFS